MKKIRLLLSAIVLGGVLSASAAALLSGKQAAKSAMADVSPLASATFSTNFEVHSGGKELLYDGDPSTICWCKDASAEKYIEFDFGAGNEIELNDISLCFDYSGGDYLRNGIVKFASKEYRSDFATIGTWSITEAKTVSLNAYGVMASIIRIYSADNNDG